MINSTQVIAEIGWNFMGDINLATQMIEAAKESGATTAKFQYWDPSKLKPGDWDKDGRKEIYKKAALDDSKIAQLKSICEDNGIECLISAFNKSGAEFLRQLGFNKIKIPSHEIANQELIKYSATAFDFVYLSTGAALAKEVELANDILAKGSAGYNLMHCVSCYPCPIESANLGRIRWLNTLYHQVGFSDHTQSTFAPALAVMLGATVIEKHFTTDKDLPGRDNKFALDKNEFTQMVGLIRDAEAMLVDQGHDYQSCESDTVENYRGRWGS